MIPIALLVLAAAFVVGRLFLRAWIVGQYNSRKMSGRKAGWLFGTTIAAPFIAIAVVTAIVDIGQLWIILLLMAVTLPVMVIPFVALFRYPTDDPGSKRFGGPVR